MRAIIIEQYGGPEQLVIRELPDPEPLPGHVVIEVKAFGLNHAEIYFRKGVWGDVAKVSGIECVGVVKADPGGRFAVGQKVAALMGGMGRAFTEAMRSTLVCPRRMWSPLTPGSRGPILLRCPSPMRPPGPASTAIWR